MESPPAPSCEGESEVGVKGFLVLLANPPPSSLVSAAID
jgi:hypothetical protein